MLMVIVNSINFDIKSSVLPINTVPQQCLKAELPVLQSKGNFQQAHDELTITKKANLTVLDLKKQIRDNLKIKNLKSIEIIFKEKVLEDSFGLNELEEKYQSKLHVILHP